jgi:hypothetical protein
LNTLIGWPLRPAVALKSLCIGRNGGPIIESVEEKRAIAGAKPAVAGVPQKLRAYIGHASMRFCCRAERPTLARRHASDSVFFHSPACRNV